MEDKTKQEYKQMEALVGQYVFGYENIKTLLFIINNTMRWFSAPLECFLRRQFGERYMS